MTAVPRHIRCCKATPRTNKMEGRSTRRNQEEPPGLITFGDGGSAPQVTQGALPKQDSGLVAHHGEDPWHPGGGEHHRAVSRLQDILCGAHATVPHPLNGGLPGRQRGAGPAASDHARVVTIGELVTPEYDGLPVA